MLILGDIQISCFLDKYSPDTTTDHMHWLKSRACNDGRPTVMK